MYEVAREAYVAHSGADMYALVNDIESYADFLPWCGDAKIIAREPHMMIAQVRVAFKGIRKTFTTRNRLRPGEKITMELQDGPFSELRGAWEFKSLQTNACKISFRLRFDFSNAVAAKLFAPVFKYIADSMVAAFVQRADEIYGAAPSRRYDSH